MATEYPVQIPASSSIVTLSVIDADNYVSNVTSEWCMSPLYDGMKTYGGPSYSFLIEHRASNTRMVFDLAIAKDYETRMRASDVKELKETLGIKIHVGSDVATELTSHGVDLKAINHIIWSHHHWDHVGNPSTFPISASIIVGPGFKQAYLPGYPTNLEGELVYYSDPGREMIEIDFSSRNERALKLGPYRAVDFFNDGSMYLLDTPGHTIGHISALCRTTATDTESTFIFLGGDIAHHCGVFRPTQYLPLPSNITPSPLHPAYNTMSCPGHTFAAIHHRRNDHQGEELARTTPFGTVAGPEEDLAESQRSVEKLFLFDGMNNVFTIFAHDGSLMDVLDYFPNSANDWKAKGWKREGLWRFLPDLLPDEQKKQLLKK